MAYRLLGIDDSVTTCECCGRSNLKCTVVLEDLETLAIVRYGRDCGAKALGRRKSAGAADKIEREARSLTIDTIEKELRARNILHIWNVNETHKALGLEAVMVRSTRWGRRWTLGDGRSFVRFDFVVNTPEGASKILPGTWVRLAESIFVGYPA